MDQFYLSHFFLGIADDSVLLRNCFFALQGSDCQLFRFADAQFVVDPLLRISSSTKLVLESILECATAARLLIKTLQTNTTTGSLIAMVAEHIISHNSLKHAHTYILPVQIHACSGYFYEMSNSGWGLMRISFYFVL